MPVTAHRVIASAVKQLRDDRGWSAQRLGQELKAIGLSWDRSIVANFENGRRAYVTVEELLALAVVLGVTPADLLAPSGVADDTPYQVTSEVVASAEGMRDWLGGGFLSMPQNPAELAEAIRKLPRERGQELNRRWFTPERMHQMNRAALEYDRDLPERSMSDLIAAAAGVSSDPAAVIREMVGALPEEGLRALQAELAAQQKGGPDDETPQ